jgi:hypothetical protein
MIKSRRIRWTGHVTCMAEKDAVGFWWEYQKERVHRQDLDIDVRIILN